MYIETVILFSFKAEVINIVICTCNYVKYHMSITITKNVEFKSFVSTIV